MSILKVAKQGNPVLLKVAEKVEQFSTENLKNIIIDMLETMIDYNGIGLAAPQIHLSKRIIILRELDNEENNDIKFTTLINPSFQPIDGETDNEWEGCLSIPGMLGLVKRYKKIKYKGYNFEGKKIIKTAEGLSARVIQHEIDHLDGILYTSRLTNQNAFGFEKEIKEFWQNETTKKRS